MPNLLSQFVPQIEDRSPRARPVQQTILDHLFRGLYDSAVTALKTPGDAVAGKFRRAPETPGYWSDADEAMQQIMTAQMANRGHDIGLNMIGAPGLAGGLVTGPAASLGIVPVDVARKIGVKPNLPKDAAFEAAVRNTPGASIDEGMLRMNVQRNQRPEQEMAESVRGGVFYLPQGDKNARYYSGKNENFAYGGNQKIAGETGFVSPLFVKGATGGKAPEAAFDQLLGKGSYQSMRTEALRSTGVAGLPRDIRNELVEEFLTKFAPELSGYGGHILENSRKGNQLAYALQEAAVASAARKAGHDGVVGYSTSRKTKEPFISEVFDVREKRYPSPHGDYDVWPPDAFGKGDVTLGSGSYDNRSSAAILGARYNPLLDPERMSLAQEQAVAKRGRGIPTGKDAPGWDFKRPEAEAGSWADSVARARTGLRNDTSNAMETWRYETNPLMNPADWDEMTKRGFVLGSGTGDKSAAAAIQGIRAYHGSPHDFDRFDLSKIGTGEGAQAYGHGLYFAESEGTAKWYRDNLADLKPRALEGHPDVTMPSWVAKTIDSKNPQAFADMRADFQGRLADMKRQLADPNTMQPWNIEANIPGIENILKALDLAEKGVPLKAPGKMYEVNINAKPEQFLDWDKPLGDQLDIARKLGWTDEAIAAHRAAQTKDTDDLLAALTGDANSYRPTDYKPPNNLPPLTATGGDFLRGGTVFDSASDAAKAQKLREAGIPGIRYLDQGSRGVPTVGNGRVQATGSGKFNIVDDFGVQAGPFDTLAEAKQYLNPEKNMTRNYVVFDDQLVNIVKKYGMGGLSMLPPGAAAYLSHKIKPVDYDPFGQPVDHDPFADRS